MTYAKMYYLYHDDEFLKKTDHKTFAIEAIQDDCGIDIDAATEAALMDGEEWRGYTIEVEWEDVLEDL